MLTNDVSRETLPGVSERTSIHKIHQVDPAQHGDDSQIKFPEESLLGGSIDLWYDLSILELHFVILLRRCSNMIVRLGMLARFSTIRRHGCWCSARQLKVL